MNMLHDKKESYLLVNRKDNLDKCTQSLKKMKLHNNFHPENNEDFNGISDKTIH